VTEFKQYLYEVLVGLGSQRKKLPWLLGLFAIVSVLDLIGISLVGGYISLLTQPDPNLGGFLRQWLSPVSWSRDNSALVLGLGGLLIMVFLLKAICAIFVNWIILRFANNHTVRLRSQIMHAFQHLAYIRYLQRSSSSYIQSVQNYVNQFTGTLVLLLRIISEGIVALAILFLLASVNLTALVILFCFGLVIFLGYDISFRKRVLEAGRVGNLANQDLIRAIQEGFFGLKEVRILGKENYFFNQVLRCSQTISRVATFTAVIGVSPRYLVELAIVVFVVSLVGITYLQTGDIEASYPLVGMFGVAALRLGPAVTMVISSVVSLRNQRHGISMLARDLNEIREEKVDIKGGESASETTFKKLELQNVCFAYESAIRPALENISLEVAAGESIGLIGASGSGKTTLVDVMLGLLQPQSGKVLYNGAGVNENISVWRSNVAYLPQDVFLIDDSLRCNIALGIPENEINEQALNDVIEKARLQELIPELSDGAETMIGERGVRLSGGQRQRVALARALYHGRDVLVLDEATSALDNETEREIVSEIQELKGEKTMIVIAHRLTTLQHCDRIYRLHQGQVVEVGSYREVVRST